MLNFKKLRLSFKLASEGLKIAVLEEQTFKFQLIIGGLVFFFMFCFPLASVERIILVLTVVFILGLELINSQVERVLDFLCPDHDPRVKRIKDLSAAAVLIACLGSIFIGLLIFLPYILPIF